MLNVYQQADSKAQLTDSVFKSRIQALLAIYGGQKYTGSAIVRLDTEYSIMQATHFLQSQINSA